MADEGRLGESWSVDLSIIFTRTGRYIILALYILYKLKKDFKGNSVFKFIESVLKEFEEI